MDRQARRQPWYRLSSLTWLAALALTAALVEVNLDALASRLFTKPVQDESAYDPILVGSGLMTSYYAVGQLPSGATFDHGWPFCYLSRSRYVGSEQIVESTDLFVDADGQLSSDLVHFTVLTPPGKLSSRWPFDAAHVTSFSGAALAGNIALALAILLGTIWTIERWSRRTGASARFGLKAILAATAWAASVVVLARNDLGNWAPVIVQTIVTAPLLAGIGLAWLAAIDVGGLIASALWQVFLGQETAEVAAAGKMAAGEELTPGAANKNSA